MNIDDYKDRETAPIGVIRINPKTNKPYSAKELAKVMKAEREEYERMVAENEKGKAK